ncbi:S-layer homology domain-containing protein [Saccharibacillus alkalitolerans]|uniref:S-layer homology domain-containing protein n=1 Tax=Saccharibacillus alkalitolerans TaxID=2705290 RepID=A0ABX0F9Y8_9BACL|nr:S-layer homology domain-containing protein [Saccharibacillus alkalitolerans]NGZ77746.1 S-layer homology domain-containing protein [Saccharibacillus alkalitolerans]
MGKKIAKWAGIALAAVLTTGVIGGAGAKAEGNSSNSFRDIQPNHWAAGEIDKGVARGYVAGYTNGTFKPDVNVTRAEFVKMVVSALNLQVHTESGKWYEPYVIAAGEQGLYKAEDFANTDSSWNEILTREEMARIANRAIGQKENEKEHPWMYMPKHKSMYTATKNGLLTGVGKGEIAPDGATTRAQAVVVIERILAANAGEKLPVDKYAVSSAEVYWHGTNIFTVMPEIFYKPEERLGSNGRNESADYWYEDRMTINSKDGLYQGKLDALIAIDLADPNDPNLKLLPPIEELKWSNNRHNQDPKDFMVKDQKDSYILYFKTHTVYNKNPKAYSTTSPPHLSVSGFESPDRDAFYYKNELNALTWIYHKKDSDLSAYIIPKGRYQKRDTIIIDLATPAFSNYGYSSNRILHLWF